MRVLDPGHQYELDDIHFDSEKESSYKQMLVFVKRFRNSQNHTGTNCQELLRVLIDRVQFLDKELPWTGNEEILSSLRKALILFEARALIRKVEKGELLPEDLEVGKDGHFKFIEKEECPI